MYVGAVQRGGAVVEAFRQEARQMQPRVRRPEFEQPAQLCLRGRDERRLTLGVERARAPQVSREGLANAGATLIASITIIRATTVINTTRRLISTPTFL